MSRLGELAAAGRAHAVVSEVTRNPDPVPTHTYEASPHSGAGNCECGAPERHRIHPHEFMAAGSQPDLCTCALPREAQCHGQVTP